MASASIEKLKDQIQGMKASKARANLKRKGEELTHTVVGGAAAFAIGRVEKGATAPLPTIFGLDPKLLYGAGAHFVSTGSSGKFGDFASAVGDGLIAAYGYAEGKGSALRGVMGASHDNSSADDFEAV